MTHAERSKQRAERIAAGLCVDCANIARLGKTRCEECGSIERARAETRRRDAGALPHAEYVDRVRSGMVRRPRSALDDRLAANGRCPHPRCGLLLPHECLAHIDEFAAARREA
jgi:hypothetical protein